MFSARKRLEARVATLETTLRQQSADAAVQLRRLRTQVAGLSSGIPISLEAILEGRAYTDIASEQIEFSLKAIPNLLVLDIRADGPWTQAHLADAKHVPAAQLAARLQEMPDRQRPILVVGEADHDAIPCCNFLAREGYLFLFLAVGGMANYRGPTVGDTIAPIDATTVRGVDRALVERVAQLIDHDVRPGLRRDGGDLELLAVENGVVTIRMIGACHGCGSQKMTLQQGIKTYLTHTIPEIRDIEAV